VAKVYFDFYTIDGAIKLEEFLSTWTGGKLVLNIAEMPIKCPVAPLEFIFLADDFFKQKGIRDKVDLTLATPLSGAFTKPVASKHLGEILKTKNINLVTDFNIGEVNNEKKAIISWDEREVPFDVLVTIPTNMGDQVIERSGMGDEFSFVPTDKHTLQSKNWDNVFVIGDATDLPSSKAGSVVHFEAEILEENIMSYLNGEPMEARFDGHANCFIESGEGKGFLIDFNYETEPLPGKFPIPGVGPFSLLQESILNHWGKLAFKWIYWNMLLKGKELPLVHANMSMKGKKQKELETVQ
jgi:sulfide:quinone oxidoreductase